MRTVRAAAAAAAFVLLGGTSVLAQQTPSDNGTDANGPITILKNALAEPSGVRVDIDGAHVDNLQTADYADITGVVHPGQNVVTVRWNQPLTALNFKIAYAPTRNNFKTVLLVQSNASRDGALRHPGARTLTFTIPG